MSDEQVKVTVTADTRPYQRELNKAADATSGVDRAQDELRRKSAKNAVAWAAVGTAVTVAGTKMLSTLNEAVDAAGDLAESTSKMRVIFGKASTDIEQFGQTSAESLGMSTQAAYDAASMMATFGKAAGLTGKDLSKFSLDMVALSSDLASFYNTSPADAMEALGAALRGEAEPIRRYGVLLDDASLRQRALAMGIIATTKEALTPQQRALAAQAEILAQTSDAQGDFARTSDGMANSQRKAQAAIDDAKAALGEALIPFMTKGANAVADLANAFTDLPGPVRDAVALIAGAAAAVALFGPAAAGIVKGLGAARGALAAYRAEAVATTVATDALTASSVRLSGSAGLAAAAKSAGVVGVGIAALAGITMAAKHQIDELSERSLNKMVDALKAAAAAGQDLGSVLHVDLAGGEALDGIAALTKALEGSEVRAKQVKPAFESLDAYLSGLTLAEARTAHDQLARSVEAAGGSVKAMDAALPGYISAQRDSARAAAEQASAEQGKTQSVEEANKAQQAALDVLTGYINAQLAAAGSADALIGATDRLRKANKDNGDALAGATAKAAANREALRSEIGLVLANAQAKVEMAKAAGKDTVAAYEIGNKAIRDGKRALRESAIEAGYTEDDVDKLLRKYMKLPPDVKTKIGATGIDAATGKVRNYKSELDGIPSSIVTRWKLTYSGGWEQYARDHGLPTGQKRATGGKVHGPGGPRSDSVHLQASPGEWVIQESSSRKYGDQFMAALNAGTISVASPAPAYSAPQQPGAASGLTINAPNWSFSGMAPQAAAESVVTALAESGYRQGVR